MKRLLNLVYSNKATLWLLLVFAIAMGVATFVEDKYDTPTAYNYIYGAKWFELVILLLGINFIGNIKRYNLMSKKKLSGFLFHMAFIIMIIGAGVTRYFGFEGQMHIREGEASNIIVSPERVFKVLAVDKGGEFRLNIPLNLKDTPNLNLQKSFTTNGGSEIEIDAKEFYTHATYAFVENIEGGMDFLKLNVFDNGNEADIFIEDKGNTGNEAIQLTFNNNSDPNAFQFYEQSGKVFVKLPIEMKTLTIPMMEIDTISAGTVVELTPMTQYSKMDNSFKFIFHQVYKKAKRKLTNGDPNANGVSALMVNVNFNNKIHEVPLFISPNGLADMQNASIEGISLLFGYGEKETRLPFSVKLRDFILDRYPGSANPSSYASEVTVVDKRDNTNFRL
jgi:hypothetical protein